MSLLLIVSLVVIGGLVLLLGSLVLLVVCSGINALSDDVPRPDADEASRSETSMAAVSQKRIVS